MNSSHLLNEIHNLVNQLLKNTSQKNRMNLGDQANYLEDLFGNIFNVLYKYDVENANQERSNEQAVDLVDENKKVVLQVTTRQSGFPKKKKDTIKGFLKSDNYIGFKKLYLLFLTEQKVDTKNLTKDIIRLGCEYEGIDLIKLLNKIKAARVPIKQQILKLLDEELSKLENLTSPSSIDLINLKNELDCDLNKFLSLKYFANTGKTTMPLMLNRQVKRFNEEVKISMKDLEETAESSIKNQEVVVGDLSSFVLSEKPSFLFGEMGSGKSTMIAELFLHQNKDTEGVHILIPANLIKGNITEHTSSVVELLTIFLTKQLLIQTDTEAVVKLLKEHVVMLGFDGLDELAMTETTSLVKHLIKLTETFNRLTIVATGRPIELQNVINHRDWNCLSTIDLSLSEMTDLLINESRADGNSPEDAKMDANKRITYIKTRSDLLSLAITPLVITMIRDHLSELSDSLSLGDILYKVMKAKLTWDSKDQKKYTRDFFNAYPSVFDRETFVAILSETIHASVDKSISEEILHRLISKQINDSSTTGKKLAHYVEEFLKSTFLQKLNDKYSFISQPLLDTAYGIHLADHFLNIPVDVDFVSINWRSLSISAAIIRARGETNKYRDHFLKLQQIFLVKESNTTQAAVIAQELGDSILAKDYIRLLKPLKFRPLRVWKDQDSNLQDKNSFSPIALANTIAIAGTEGFDWFFKEYLDVRYPLNMYESGISANLLLFYLIKNNFTLPTNQSSQIKSIISYHLYYRTFACTNLLPVICLLLPGDYKPEHRAGLLLIMLKKDVSFDRAKLLFDELIKEDGNSTILNAIEIYASETEENHKPEIIQLWYKYHEGFKLNDAVFKATISAIVHGAKFLIDLLIIKIGSTRLLEYLKLLCLTDSTRSDECAILLFEYFGIRDFYLTARPIMMFSKWHHGKDLRRKKILDLILFDKSNPAAELITKINFTDKDELPLLCYEYYIKCFQFLDQELEGLFYNTIKYLPKYSLTRNPSLRDSVRKLLKHKKSYSLVVKNATLSLDMNVRRNAQHLIIACMPDDCAEELIATARGSLDKLPREDEWLAFVYKLDFSDTVLVQLHETLSTLNPLGKTFALIILYRNNYKLSNEEENEFVRSLMGKGQYYDKIERFSQQNRLLGDPKFLPILLETLKQDKEHYFESTASLLHEYHKSAITQEDLLYVTVIQIEKHSTYIFNFVYEYADRFYQDDFQQKLRLAITKVKAVLGITRSITEILLMALLNDHKQWIALFEAIFHQHNHFEEQSYFPFQSWLMFLRKTQPLTTTIAGKAALEMSTAPANIQGFNSRTPNGVLLLLADEFYKVDKNSIAKVLTDYNLLDDLYTALAARLGRIPENCFRKSNKSYLGIFKENKSTNIEPYSALEIASYLTTSIDLPENFDSFLRSIVVYGSIDNEFLNRKDYKPLENLIAVIIEFLQKDKIDFKPLLEVFDQIDNRRNFRDFVGLMHIIKEIRLMQPNGKEIYASDLKNKILINRRHFLGELEIFYTELFRLKIPLSFEFFQILVEEIIARQYVLQMELLYLICEHISEDISVSVHEELADLLYIYITSTLEFTDEGHENDYYNIQWLFALIYLYVKKQTNNKVTFCFLMGLQSIFIQDSRIGYRISPQLIGQFKGRELINHSANLFDKVSESLVQNMLQVGLTIDIPEIRVVCRLLRSFHKPKS